MFDRTKRESKDEGSSYPVFESREPTGSTTARTRLREAAVIGPSIQINGDLSGEEDLIIQGRVQGTIQLKEKKLTVGTQGKVDANVVAQSVVVEGQVRGDLYGSESVAIRATGNVHGNIVSPKVGLEEGCRFKGSIDMDDEAVSRAFGKRTSTTVGRAEGASARLKAPEAAGQTGTEADLVGTTQTKSGSAG